MKKLNKHFLNFQLSWDYIEDNLNQTNELSSQILEIISNVEGMFYTFLPLDADIMRIHEFNSGYMTSFIDEEICRYVSDLAREKQCSCIFDDVNVNLSDNWVDEFTNKYSMSYENEIYYVIKKETLSDDLFLQCMKESGAIWHSLCILTKVDLDPAKKILDRETIRNICEQAQLVMIGSYDGEGYIFWEKSKKA